MSFLYNNSEPSETEPKGKKSHLLYSTIKIKYPGIHLTKKVKDLYSENYRTLKKEIEEDKNKWKHLWCSFIGRITSLKCPYYPKQSTDSTQSLLKYQWHISQI